MAAYFAYKSGEISKSDCASRVATINYGAVLTSRKTLLLRTLFGQDSLLGFAYEAAYKTLDIWSPDKGSSIYCLMLNTMNFQGLGYVRDIQRHCPEYRHDSEIDSLGPESDNHPITLHIGQEDCTMIDEWDRQLIKSRHRRQPKPVRSINRQWETRLSTHEITP